MDAWAGFCEPTAAASKFVQLQPLGQPQACSRYSAEDFMAAVIDGAKPLA
jgi:hypothetical protein